jgi:hypothetical protein
MRLSMAIRLSEDEYRSEFKGDPESDKQKRALDYALDIRKFEIGLYWTRATYFWTFIGVSFAAYGAIQVLTTRDREDLSVVLSCVGFVFSFAWYCVNRGSKQWQENWENHVDLLEDEIAGPLYKVILQRSDPETNKEKLRAFLTGPAPFSVSKINQLISLYICAVWIFLYFHALPKFSAKSPVDWEYVVITALTLFACRLIWKQGRTQEGKYKPIATKRETQIAEPASKIESDTKTVRNPQS